MSNFNVKILGLIIASVSVPSATVAQIAVKVHSDNGDALMGAAVRLNRLPAFQKWTDGMFRPKEGEAVFNRQLSATDPDGRVLAPLNLPDGRYSVCVELDGFLDPCKWGPATFITVRDQADEHFQLTLSRGVSVDVAIDDPKGLILRGSDSVSSGGNLVVGIHVPDQSDDGAYSLHQLLPSGVDRNVTLFRTAVPPSTKSNLWIFTRDLVIEDASGRLLPLGGAMVPLEASLGVAAELRFRVSAKAAGAQ